MKKLLRQNTGQTLMTLLFFVTIAITVTTAAIIAMYSNAQSATKVQQGAIAYYVAEGGIENALIRLLRDPTYTGETLPVGTGTAVITVTGSSSSYTITSKGTVGNFLRTIQVTAGYNSSNILTISSWQENF